jgi:predicted peroxiredoxin
MKGISMKAIIKLSNALVACLLALSFSLIAGPSLAQTAPEAKGRLFINLTSLEPQRVALANFIGSSQAEAGVPVTMLLSIDAVRIANKNAPLFAVQRADLENTMKAGVRVIVNPRSMMYHGMTDGDLMEGVQKGNPKLLREALIVPNTSTLTW